MRIEPSATRFHRGLQALLLWILVFAPNLAQAQQIDNRAAPQVQQLYAEAKAAQQAGDNPAAIQKYLAIIRLAPQLAPAYNNLGMLDFKERDYPRAVEVLKHCLELAPDMHSASAVSGMSYFELRRSEDAEPLLRAALNANPIDDNVEMMLALALIDLRKDREAATHLESFMERNPKSLDGWSLLRKTYLQMSEDARAEINAIDPDSAIAHEVAGEIDESANNYAAALMEYKKAIDRAPIRQVPICIWSLPTGISANGVLRRRNSSPSWRTIRITVPPIGNLQMPCSRQTTPRPTHSLI